MLCNRRARLNESPSEKEGKCYPKIARNHAAETGASREPRGGYTQNYTLQPHLPPHNSLAREETMRATRHVPVTYQVLAHTKTPAGCFLSDPARVLTYERGWRGSGKPDYNQANHANRASLEPRGAQKEQRVKPRAGPSATPANSGTSAPPPHPAGPHEPTPSNETPHGNTSSGNHRPASPG